MLTWPDAAILDPRVRILYGFITSLAQLAVRSGRSKDLQIIVLGHENSLLRRQIDRPAIKHTYLLSGHVYCAECGRRMQGSWNH